MSSRASISNLTPVTATFLASTVTEQVAVLPPSDVVTVMVAVPALTAVTWPPLTVATPVLEEDQLTPVLVALEGATEAVRVSLPPSVRVMELLLRLTPVTATVVGVEGVGLSGLSGSSGPQPAKNVAMAVRAMAMRVLVIGVFMVLCIKAIVLNSLSPLFFENKYNKNVEN